MTHEIKPIRNDQDHAEALVAAESLWQAEPGTPEHDRLKALAMLIDEYESRRWATESADPVDLQDIELVRQRVLRLQEG